MAAQQLPSSNLGLCIGMIGRTLDSKLLSSLAVVMRLMQRPDRCNGPLSLVVHFLDGFPLTMAGKRAILHSQHCSIGGQWQQGGWRALNA